MTRVYGEMVPAPFNHTCRNSEDGNLGCNDKGDWSCDFKFEQSLYRRGLLLL